MDVRNVKRTFRAAARPAAMRGRGGRPRSRLVLLCPLAAALLAAGCGGGPAPPGGAEEAAGEAAPAVEQQAPEEQVPEAAPPLDAEAPAGAEAGTGAAPQAAAEPAIGRDQALGVARRQVLFEPETELAELAADEEPPVWRVTLRGRRPGGSLFAFEQATVTVDARTGDVLGVEAR